MKRKLLILPAGIAIAAIAAACGGSSSSSSSSSSSGGAASTPTTQTSAGGTVKKGGILKGAVAKDYDYWDGTSYYGDMWSWEFVSGNALLDYPDSVGPDVNQLIPGVAADLPQVSADGLTYTFKIRQGLKFSNGKAVTPEDVKATFERSLDPGGQFDAQISTSYYANIAGYDKYTATGSDGKPLASNPKTLSGITVQDPDTVVFHLTKADPGFLYAVALRFMNIVPAGSPHKHTDMPPPMTGAYMMTARTPNRSVSFRRNPNWDSNAKIMGIDTSKSYNVDGIDIAIGQSTDQIYLQIKNNQIDFDVAGTEELNPPQLQEIASTPDLKSRFYVNPDSSIRYYWMNAHIAPFDNLKLRQAVNYAIDRSAQEKLVGGTIAGEPWSQILSKPLMKNYVSDTNAYPTSPDLTKAKQLVQESGVKTPIAITLAFNNSSPANAQSASALKSDLQQVGFNVTVKPVDPSAYYQTIQNPKKSIQMGWGGWTQDYSDGSTFFGPLLGYTSQSNYGQFQDKALQANIDKVSAMPTGPDREKAWAQLSDSTERDAAPWAVYANRNFYELTSNRYGGYAWNPTKQRYYALAFIK